MGHQPLMPQTIQEQKREIIEKGIKAILEESSIPQRIHLKMVQTLKDQVSGYQKELEEASNSRTEHESLLSEHASSFNDFSERVNSLVSSLEQEVQRLTAIDHLKGDDGKSVEINDVLPHLIPHLPQAEKVDHKKIVMDVLDMMPIPEKEETQELDTEALFEEFVTRIQKERLIDVSHIKNAESFIFNGTKYKIEELMRGAGGSSANNTAALTEVVTGIQSGNDVAISLSQLTQTPSYLLFVTKNGQILMPNGSSSFPGSSWSEAGTTITVYNADASSDFFQIQYVPIS